MNNIVTPAEIEERYGITQQTRSKWTKQYEKFLSPPGDSYHRQYTNEDFATFDFIVECKNRHMTVNQISALLEEGATEIPEIVETEKLAKTPVSNQHTPPPARRTAPKPENSLFASFGELKERVNFINENQGDLEWYIDDIKVEMKKLHNRLLEIEKQLGTINFANLPNPESGIVPIRQEEISYG